MAFRKREPYPIEDAEKIPVKDKDVPDAKVVSSLPKISIGDTVTISGNDFTITPKDSTSSTTYYGKGLDNITPNPIDSIVYDTKIGSISVKAQGIFQARRIIAFQDHIATNPLETISYLRIMYEGRTAVISEVSLFFAGTLETLEAFQRDKSDKVIPLTIDKGLLSNDSGAVNKIAYVIYGSSEKDNLAKAATLIDTLSSTSKSVIITDTSVSSAQLEADAFMRARLREWGIPVPDTLTGTPLELLYTSEHQKRVPKLPEEEGASMKRRGTIAPNPQVTLKEPIIKHPTLPVTPFRQYASKILLITLFGAGVIMYQRSIKNRDVSAE